MSETCLRRLDELRPEQFRRAMGRFATGVGLVTSLEEGRPYGMTVNAFTSVSLDPPLVLVCIQKEGHGHRVIQAQGAFAVNILGAHQKPLAERFAGRHHEYGDPFADVPWRVGSLGLPLLLDVQSFVECRLVETVDAGDHSIFLGQVVHLGIGPVAPPLLFFGGSYHALGERLVI